MAPDLPGTTPYTLEPGQPTPGWPSLLRHPIAAMRGIGILTDFPSTTRFRLALGADLPCADERCAGNLGLSAGEIFTPLIVTHVSIRTSDISSMPHSTPSQTYRTLPYRSEDRRQMTVVRRATSNFCAIHSASWRFPDTRHASDTMFLRLCSQDQNSSEPKRASRRSNLKP